MAILLIDVDISHRHVMWSHVLQGSAVLYVDKRHQSTIRPTVVSSGYHHGFPAEFAFLGIYIYHPIHACVQNAATYIYS